MKKEGRDKIMIVIDLILIPNIESKSKWINQNTIQMSQQLINV